MKTDALSFKPGLSCRFVLIGLVVTSVVYSHRPVSAAETNSPARIAGTNNAPATQTGTASDAEAQAILDLYGRRDVQVHDPSTIVKCKDEYWLFSTGNGVFSRRSKDLVNWTNGPRVFTDRAPAWTTNAVPGNRGHLWAPDVIHLNDRYLLYYSISTFGRNTSAIGLVTNPTLDPANPDYAWKDEGLVVRSQATNDFNTIDPAVTLDADGGLWMAFGSFWSGIKMIELDPATGKRIAPDSPMYSLAHKNAIEAVFIYHHGGRYYQFVNWDRCCRGVNSTYNIRVGRSGKITGPYLDKDGVDLLQGGGSLVLGTVGPFIGPGHAGIIVDGATYWLSCHFYNGTTPRGTATLAVLPLRWAADGWPEADSRPAK